MRLGLPLKFLLQLKDKQPFTLITFSMMEPIIYEQVSTFLANYDKPTGDMIGIDYTVLTKFIEPNTDIYLLTLLSKAVSQGFDLALVDKPKFLSASYANKPLRLLQDKYPFPGAYYTEIDMAFIMYDGQSFIYKGVAEAKGLDTDINTIMMTGDAVKYFELDDDLEWLDARIKTVSDLIIYLNGGLRKIKPMQEIVEPISSDGKNSIFHYLLFIPLIWLLIKILS